MCLNQDGVTGGWRKLQDETGGECSRSYWGEKFVQEFWQGNLKANAHLEALDIDGRLLLNWILKKSGKMVWIECSGFIQIKTNGRFCDDGNELIWPCVYRASYCNVLMNNEMHNSYNQFLFHSFLSALHISNESSRSSSAARHNILYYTVQSVQSVQASLAASS